jgi:hypothetical protein
MQSARAHASGEGLSVCWRVRARCGALWAAGLEQTGGERRHGCGRSRSWAQHDIERALSVSVVVQVFSIALQEGKEVQRADLGCQRGAPLDRGSPAISIH